MQRSLSTASQPQTAPHTGPRALQAAQITNETLLPKEVLPRKLGISTSLLSRATAQKQEESLSCAPQRTFGNRNALLDSGILKDNASYGKPPICATPVAVAPESDSKMYRSALLSRRIPSGVQHHKSLLGHTSNSSRPEGSGAPEQATGPRLLLKSMSEQLRSPKAPHAPPARLADEGSHQNASTNAAVPVPVGGNSRIDSLKREGPLSYVEARSPSPPSQLAARALALAAENGSRRKSAEVQGVTLNPQISEQAPARPRSPSPLSSALIARAAALDNERLQKAAQVADMAENARTNVSSLGAAREMEGTGTAVVPPKRNSLGRFLSHQGRFPSPQSALAARATALDSKQGLPGAGRSLHNVTVGSDGGAADARALSKSLSHQPRSTSPQSALTLRVAALAAEMSASKTSQMSDNSSNVQTADGAEVDPHLRRDDRAACAVPKGRGAVGRSLSHELRSTSATTSLAVPVASRGSASQVRRATVDEGAFWHKEAPYVETRNGPVLAPMSDRGYSAPIRAERQHMATTDQQFVREENKDTPSIGGLPEKGQTGVLAHGDPGCDMRDEEELKESRGTSGRVDVNPARGPPNMASFGRPDTPESLEASAHGRTVSPPVTGPARRPHGPSSRDTGGCTYTDNTLLAGGAAVGHPTPGRPAALRSSPPGGRVIASSEALPTSTTIGISFDAAPAGATHG